MSVRMSCLSDQSKVFGLIWYRRWCALSFTLLQTSIKCKLIPFITTAGCG